MTAFEEENKEKVPQDNFLVKDEGQPEETKVQEIFEDYDKQPEPEEETKTPVQEVIDPTPAPKLYDANADQRFSFEFEDDDAKYKVTHVYGPLYGPLADEVLAEFDRLREVIAEPDEATSSTDVKTLGIEATEYLFKEVCKDMEGQEGEKPKNWLELIDYDEKAEGIKALLGHKIIKSTKEKTVLKRIWGQQISKNTLTMKSFFDGDIVTTKAHFKDKTPGDIALYEAIKTRVKLTEKNLDDQEIKIPAAMKKKAALFDRLNPDVEGYKGGKVPLHHKAAFITARYESVVKRIEKK